MVAGRKGITNMSAGIRRREETGADRKDITNHILPYAGTRSTMYSTSHIRERLKLKTRGARKVAIVVFEVMEVDISDRV